MHRAVGSLAPSPLNSATIAGPPGPFCHDKKPMTSIFPDSITALPLANIPLDGATA